MTAIPVTVTGSPKKNIVDMAFEACGVSEYTPDEAASALRKLDAMMYEEPFDGLGYNYPVAGAGALEDLTGFAARWDQAVSLSLAQRLAPKELNGSPLSGDARATLARSMDLLRAYVATIPTGIMVSTPAGAGNRRFGFSAYIHET